MQADVLRIAVLLAQGGLWMTRPSPVERMDLKAPLLLLRKPHQSTPRSAPV